jgi:hypothetical protein
MFLTELKSILPNVLLYGFILLWPFGFAIILCQSIFYLRMRDKYNAFWTLNGKPLFFPKIGNVHDYWNLSHAIIKDGLYKSLNDNLLNNLVKIGFAFIKIFKVSIATYLGVMVISVIVEFIK